MVVHQHGWSAFIFLSGPRPRQIPETNPKVNICFVAKTLADVWIKRRLVFPNESTSLSFKLSFSRWLYSLNDVVHHKPSLTVGHESGPAVLCLSTFTVGAPAAWEEAWEPLKPHGSTSWWPHLLCASNWALSLDYGIWHLVMLLIKSDFCFWQLFIAVFIHGCVRGDVDGSYLF